jgi:hypothetical protein
MSLYKTEAEGYMSHTEDGVKRQAVLGVTWSQVKEFWYPLEVGRGMICKEIMGLSIP